MENKNSLTSHNGLTWSAMVIMDAGRGERDGMSQGRLVEVGQADSSSAAMRLAKTSFEAAGLNAIGFTAERAARQCAN